MTYAEIKNLVMFQTNNDTEDLGDYMAGIGAYVNEGYEELVLAYTGEHLVTPLINGSDVPAAPVWSHKALADWATWCIYRNGNPQKQQRGFVFKQSAEQVFSRIRSAGGAAGIANPVTQFTNIPL